MGDAAIQARFLEKICQSQTFSGSAIYQSYLTFLVEASAREADLKETTIAMDFFGKDKNFNPAVDAIVRSHTYYLRKKLEVYYLRDGRNDLYRFQIPKGQYRVTFEAVSPGDIASSVSGLLPFAANTRLLGAIGAAAVLACLFLGFYSYRLYKEVGEFRKIDASDPVWGDYLRSSLPIMIAVGDHFFFRESLPSNHEGMLALRDGTINSTEDMDAYKALHPESDIYPSPEPYFPYHSIWSLPPVLEMLNGAHQKPVLRKSSTLSPQILSEYNIIFVGSIKTLYILQHTMMISSMEFDISPHVIRSYSGSDSANVRSFETSTHSTGQNDDLVLALKLPGPANNAIFIIASYHSLGAPKIANYLCNPETLAELEGKFREKYGRVPRYFEMLFRVTGIDKTAYEAELVIFNEIKKDAGEGK
ncbi:MAG: hypothetical protein KDI06_11235 [Calditrichaeota bacterium]|nr:hypothetical protein [Calditrichota bacterium]